MTLLRPLTIASTTLLLALSGPASAASALKTTTDTMPATKFNEQDRALMMARINQALGGDKEGEILEWKSDTTPASGSVKALNRLQWNGLACRRVQIYNAYAELKAQGVYKFCEKPAGKWKLVGPD